MLLLLFRLRESRCGHCKSWPLLLLAILAGSGSAVLAQAERRLPHRPPNVLLILTDDQGYGDLHAHGNRLIRTPVLDRLRDQSARFERFFVSPLCSLTRASLLTGRYYLRTGCASVTRGLEAVRPEEVTLAEVLGRAGYATGCFGKWHIGENYPSHPRGQGFDEFFGMAQGHWDNYFDPVLEHNGRLVPTQGYITDVLTDRAIRFIRRHRDRPFFCYLPYNAPHTPMQVPDRYFDKYKALGLDDRTASVYGMVENLDENIGRLLQVLEELQLSRQTIVIFLSDNGAEGPEGSRYNAGMRGMKGSVHEGGVRVPCFVRWPGRIRPRSIHQIAAHIDLLPTIAALCGVKHLETRPLDGVNLAPLLLEKGGVPPRMIFTRCPSWRRMVAYREGVIRDVVAFPGAVRTQRWRAVNLGSGWELYDMERDPGQRHNVARQHPQVVRLLAGAYREWFAQMARPLRRPRIQLGFPQWPREVLTAPQAYFTPGLRWYNRWGFAHDWITGWTNAKDSIWWEIEVVQPGRFRVSVVYACEEDAVGTCLEVEAAGRRTRWRLQKAHPPRPRQRPSRIKKVRFIQSFAEQELGELELPRGAARIRLRVVDQPGRGVCDVHSLVLERVDAGAGKGDLRNED